MGAHSGAPGALPVGGVALHLLVRLHRDQRLGQRAYCSPWAPALPAHPFMSWAHGSCMQGCSARLPASAGGLGFCTEPGA